MLRNSSRRRHPAARGGPPARPDDRPPHSRLDLRRRALDQTSVRPAPRSTSDALERNYGPSARGPCARGAGGGEGQRLRPRRGAGRARAGGGGRRDCSAWRWSRRASSCATPGVQRADPGDGRRRYEGGYEVMRGARPHADGVPPRASRRVWQRGAHRPRQTRGGAPQGRHRDGAARRAPGRAARRCSRRLRPRPESSWRGCSRTSPTPTWRTRRSTRAQLERFGTALRRQVRTPGFARRWRHLSNSAGAAGDAEARDGRELNLSARGWRSTAWPRRPGCEGRATLEPVLSWKTGDHPREGGAGGRAGLLRRAPGRRPALAHRHPAGGVRRRLRPRALQPGDGAGARAARAGGGPGVHGHVHGGRDRRPRRGGGRRGGAPRRGRAASRVERGRAGEDAGTIHYEVLCGVGARVPRVAV